VSLVSYHFGGKEKLYHACLEQFGRARLAAAQRVLQPVKSREEFAVRLEMFVQEFLACHFEEKDLVQIIHRDCMMAAGKMENFPQELFKETFLKVFQTLVDFIAGARDKGILREDLDPMAMAGSVFGALKSSAMNDFIGKQYFKVTLEDPAHRERWVRQVVQLFTFGSFRQPSHLSRSAP
jgi:AcrR family transcriptional regulator